MGWESESGCSSTRSPPPLLSPHPAHYPLRPPHPHPARVAEGSLRKRWRPGPAPYPVEPQLARGPPTSFRGGPGERPGGEGALRATEDTFRKLSSKLRAPCPLPPPATSGGRSWGGGGSLATPEDQLPTVGRAPGLAQTVSQRQLRVKGGPETPLPKESGVCVPQEGLESAAQRSRERTDRPIEIDRGKGLPPAEGRLPAALGKGLHPLQKQRASALCSRLLDRLLRMADPPLLPAHGCST
ncbi:hypothetical protein R6Z07M_017408 [Ovis aries]